MSTEPGIPPIQPSPVKPFTLRLLNGHFVRVPKFDHLPVTDATRPSATASPATLPYGDGEMISRNLRLVNGRFVNDAPPAPIQLPSRPAPLPSVEPSPDSWAYAFGTALEPTNGNPKT